MTGVREALADLRRRVDRLLRTGTVTEVDAARARVRVRYAPSPDEAVTGWLPWLTARAGADRDWWAPSPGEGVLILAPSGELAAAVVLPALYQAARPAPSGAPDRHVVVYASGARVEHDGAAKTFTVTSAAGNAVTVDDGGNVRADGNVTAGGDVVAGGNVTAGGDVRAGGDVKAGGDVADARGSLADARTVFNAHVHNPPIGGPPAGRM